MSECKIRSLGEKDILELVWGVCRGWLGFIGVAILVHLRAIFETLWQSKYFILQAYKIDLYIFNKQAH